MIANSPTRGVPAGGGSSSEKGETLEEGARSRPDALRPARPYLFIVLDADRPLEGGARLELRGVDEVIIGRGAERRATRETRDGVNRLHLQLPSALLSSTHARLRRTAGGWSIEDCHSKNGTYVNDRRIASGPVPLAPSDFFEVGHLFLSLRELPHRGDESWPDLDASDLDPDLLGLQTLLPPLASRFENLRRISSSPVTILLWGETGTGKELLARAIHAMSGRKGPFLAVNCATLMDGLAESQLFGHVKGAFSGAVSDSIGFLRSANGGTLLLDEVGDLARPAQGTLLRVLQEQEVIAVGSARPTKIDVRFIATSPRPLDPTRRADQFRSDLFARLGGFVHEMTSLRHRREDLGLLLAAVLRRAGATPDDRARLSPRMAASFLRYTWPLNVRELEQTVVRAWLLRKDGLLDEAQVPGEGSGIDASHDGTGVGTGDGAGPKARQRADAETRARLEDALRTAQGNVSAAARALGKGRVHIHRQLRRLGLDARRFRS